MASDLQTVRELPESEGKTRSGTVLITEDRPCSCDGPSCPGDPRYYGGGPLPRATAQYARGVGNSQPQARHQIGTLGPKSSHERPKRMGI